MREIKFRAWDKKQKGMCYFNFDDIGIADYISKPSYAFVWCLKKSEYKNNPHLYSCDEVTKLKSKNTIVMQYTGLKDKKGKEIYEGDIVLVNNPQDITGDFTNSKQKVFFYEGTFYHGNGERPPKTMWKYCKVIGNIYENPELLK